MSNTNPNADNSSHHFRATKSSNFHDESRNPSASYNKPQINDIRNMYQRSPDKYQYSRDSYGKWNRNESRHDNARGPNDTFKSNNFKKQPQQKAYNNFSERERLHNDSNRQDRQYDKWGDSKWNDSYNDNRRVSFSYRQFEKQECSTNFHESRHNISRSRSKQRSKDNAQNKSSTHGSNFNAQERTSNFQRPNKSESRHGSSANGVNQRSQERQTSQDQPQRCLSQSHINSEPFRHCSQEADCEMAHQSKSDKGKEEKEIMESSLVVNKPEIEVNIDNTVFGSFPKGQSDSQIYKNMGKVSENKEPSQRMYLNKKSYRKVSHSLKTQLHQIMAIEKFIDVSKTVVNKFVDFLEHFKQDFLTQVTCQKEYLRQGYKQSELKFANEAFQIFNMVLKAHMRGYNSYREWIGHQQPDLKARGFNFTSFQHAVRRIHKACQIQIEDFQWKQGIYSEDDAAQQLVAQGLKKKIESQEEMNIYMEIFKQQTNLMQELIELEQVCKQHVELFKRNFVQLFDSLKPSIVETACTHLDNQKKTSLIAFFQRFANYSDQAKLLTYTEEDPKKVIDVSLVDAFDTNDLQLFDQSNTMLIMLLEVGNSIDGVTIASKIITSLTKDKDKLNASFPQNFSRFLLWKKRKCHCCMEYILDAGKAVTCFNLINKDNPCMNIYCQNCVVSFYTEKFKYEDPDANATKTVDDKKKENEDWKNKRKMWLKASQNILFICPCCQGHCLTEDTKKHSFSMHSICNLNFKLEHHPKSFLKKEIYMYLSSNGVKKLFKLCKIVGIVKHKALHRVEILQNSQVVSVKLAREEFFFNNTVKPDSKIFKVIDEQGFELDIKKQMDRYIRDIQDHNTYPLLDKYKDFLFKQDLSKDEFVIPKFGNVSVNNLRKQFVETHRELYRRSENQSIFIKFEMKDETLLYFKESAQSIKSVVSKKESEQNDQQQQLINPEIVHEEDKHERKESEDKLECQDQVNLTDAENNLALRQPRSRTVTNYKILNEHGRDAEHVPTPKQPSQPIVVEKTFKIQRVIPFKQEAVKPLKIETQEELEENKPYREKLLQKLIRDQKNEPFDINKRVFKQFIPTNYYQYEKIGNIMVREKNIMLAKEHNVDYGDNYQLLITKEVFKVEFDYTREILPFAPTYLFSEIPQDTKGYQWPYAEMPGFVPKHVPLTQVQSQPQHTIVSDFLNRSFDGPPKKDIEKRNDVAVNIVQEQIIQEQPKPQEEDEAYIKFLQDLQQSCDRKEYNLRQTTNTRTNNNVFVEKDSLKKQTPMQVLQKQFPINNQVEEGFYDDFPPEIIKKFNLQVSNRAKESVYPNKRQKISDTVELQKGMNHNSEVAKQPDEKVSDTLSQQNQRTDLEGLQKAFTCKDSVSCKESSQVSKPISFENCVLKRFKITPQLEEHYKIVKEISLRAPKKLVGLFVYVYTKHHHQWLRIKLVKFIPDQQTISPERRYYQCKFNGNQKIQVRNVNLLESMFIIDCQYNETHESQEVKQISVAQIDSQVQLTQQPRFNNKETVRKLLNKWTKKLEVKKAPTSTEKVNNVASSKQFETAEEKLEEELKEEEVFSVQKEEVNKEEVVVEDNLDKQPSVSNQPASHEDQPMHFVNNEPVLPIAEPLASEQHQQQQQSSQQVVLDEEEAPIQEQNANEEMEVDQVEEKAPYYEQSIIDDQMVEEEDKKEESSLLTLSEPKQNWVKDMQVKIIKSGSVNNQHERKFYYQRLKSEDFSSFDDNSEDKIEVAKNQINNNKLKELFDQIQQHQMRKQIIEKSINNDQNSKMQTYYQDQQQQIYQISLQMRQQEILQQASRLIMEVQPYVLHGTLEQKKMIIQNLQQELYVFDQHKTQLLAMLQNLKLQQEQERQPWKFIPSSVQEQQLQQTLHFKIDQIQKQIQQLYNVQQFVEQLLRQIYQSIQYQYLGINQQQSFYQIMPRIDQAEDVYQQQLKEDSIQAGSYAERLIDNHGGANTYDQNDQLYSDQNTLNDLNLYQNHLQLNNSYMPSMPQQPVYYLIQTPGLNQMQIVGRDWKANSQIPRQKLTGDPIVVNHIENEETILNNQEFIAQVQEIVDELANIDDQISWDTIVSNKKVFEQMEKGMQLLKQDQVNNNIVEEYLMRLMNIHPDCTSSELFNSDFDLGLYLAKEDQGVSKPENTEENSNEIPEFFMNHIFMILNTKQHQNENQQLDQHLMNESHTNPKPGFISKQRLMGMVNKFYHKMIINNCHKKCKCAECQQRLFPFLIKFNVEYNQFYEVHSMMNQQISSLLESKDRNQSLTVSMYLQLLLTQRFTEDEMKLNDAYYSDLKQQQSQNRETQEYIQHNPAFKELVESQIHYVKEGEFLDQKSRKMKLPSLNNIIKSDFKISGETSFQTDQRTRAFQTTKNNVMDQLKQVLEYLRVTNNNNS